MINLKKIYFIIVCLIFILFGKNLHAQNQAYAGTINDIFSYADGFQLNKNEEVLTSFILPNDPLLYRQWPVINNGKIDSNLDCKPKADIDLARAWSIETGSKSITVAILDGGINFSDEEFEGRIWQNTKEIPGNGIDDDNNGYIDDVQGWNFTRNNNNPTDEIGHGTHVAGIIGANANNNIGYAGVDWNCKLMILKVVDAHGMGEYSHWAKAIYYAVDNGANVINMSIGGNHKSKKLRKAIEYAYIKNVVVVAAMMNANSSVKYYPAAFPQGIAVGATGPDDERCSPFGWSKVSGSNYGIHIDVVAPGRLIYGVTTQGYNMFWDGTSQATPFVTGLVALLLAQDATRTAEEIKHIIFSTAEDSIGHEAEDTPGWDKYYGNGRINAYKALLLGRQLVNRE